MIAYVIIILSIGQLAITTPTFDPDLAKEIFSYSQPAYCNLDVLKAWSCTPCKKHSNMQELQVFYNNSHAAQGYCGYDAQYNRVIISIRGSDDIKNWQANIDLFMTNYRCSGCKVHEGFHKVYEDLANNLLACAYLLKSNHPTAKTIVTGHSLGAAQSSFAAIEIQEEIGTVDYLYNYGSPRVGNAAFVSYIERTLGHTYIARITHWKDIFLHAPTQSVGFHHYGHEIFYDQDSLSYKICDKSEDDKCANQFFWPWQWVIKDHLFYFGQCSGCEQAGCDKY